MKKKKKKKVVRKSAPVHHKGHVQIVNVHVGSRDDNGGNDADRVLRRMKSPIY